MLFRKKRCFGWLLTLPLLGTLFSCSTLSVREDLKAFSEGFSVTKCLNSYKSASFSYSLHIYENDNEVGLATREISFSRDLGKDFYNFEEKGSGKALDVGFSESLTRLIEPSLDGYKETETEMGETQTKPVSKDLFNSIIDSFFFTDEESGYVSGGVYYGDFIKLNFRYQEAMRIENDETLVLDYDGLKPKEGQEGSIYIKVDKWGMALDYSFEVKDDKTTMITSFCVMLLSETNL